MGVSEHWKVSRFCSKALILGLGLLILLLLAGCKKTSPEVQLRARIAEMQEALEERQPAVFIEGIADDFSTDSGLDREAVRNLLRVQMLQNASIGATLGPIDVVIQGDRATVQFSAVMTGGSGRFLPDTARPWMVESGWRDGSDGWQMIYAKWEPLL